MTAIICLRGSDDDRLRIKRAAQRPGELIVVAPPEVRMALGPRGMNARWTDGARELAAPTPRLRGAVAAAQVVKELHQESRLDEVRYAALEGDGWAVGLFSRQSGDLAGVRLVAELPEDATPLLRPLALGDDHEVAVEKGAALAALRDADQVEGADGVRTGLVDAKIQMGSPRPPLREHRATVSAVVTHFNLERYLPGCLDTLRTQTVPVEIVLVDDGSDAPGLAVLDEQARRDPGMHVIRQGNQGLARARNAGVAACSGELVLIVDADNLMRPRMVEVLTEALLRRSEADVAVPAFRAFEDGTDRTLFHYCPVELDAPPLFIANIGGDACALHRKEALLATGGFRRQQTAQGGLEDWELWLTYVSAGRRSAAVPEVLFDYRVRPNSLLRSRSWEEELHGYFALAAAHPALLAKVSREVTLLATARLKQLLNGAAHDGHARAAKEYEPLRQQAAECAAALQKAQELEFQLTNAEAATTAARAELKELREGLDELRSSSAVRAAELLRVISPNLHRALGKVLRTVLRSAR